MKVDGKSSKDSYLRACACMAERLSYHKCQEYKVNALHKFTGIHILLVCKWILKSCQPHRLISISQDKQREKSCSASTSIMPTPSQ